MSDTPGGPPPRPRAPRTATVAAVRRLTPNLVRITLTGDEIANAELPDVTDRYIKLALGAPPEPGGRPLLRAYTIRSARAQEWDLDLVIHGDDGLGGRWARRAQPGDRVTFFGPGGAYGPDPAAPWHLLVGDDSALPAIAATLEALPEGARAHAFVEVPGPADEQAVVTTGDVHLTWVHRGTRTLPQALAAAHAAGALPPGVPHAFLHGEAGCVRELRRWVRAALGVPRELLSASGYWRRGRDDEGWRAEKREWVAAVERDDLGLEVA